jgi:hypothetical protein
VWWCRGCECVGECVCVCGGGARDCWAIGWVLTNVLAWLQLLPVYGGKIFCTNPCKHSCRFATASL